MSTKKLLTYEGLEEYNIKWHERLQAMAIDDEVDDIFIDEMMKEYTWRFVYNTDSLWGQWYYSSYFLNKIGSVPFSLYGTQNKSMTIDWGDGTSSTLTSNDFSSDPTICTANQHLYSTTGSYIISVTSSDWDSILMLGGCSGIGGYTSDSFDSPKIYDIEEAYGKLHGDPSTADMIPMYFDGETSPETYTIQYVVSMMRLGMTQILDPLPKLAGTLWSDRNLDLPSSMINDFPKYGDIFYNHLDYILSYYQHLTIIPSNLFMYNRYILSLEGVFWGTNGSTPYTYAINFTGLEHILEDCINVQNVSRCFLESTSPSEIWLSSNSITSAVDFSDDPITVHLPTNSSSAAAFQNESNVTIGV